MKAITVHLPVELLAKLEQLMQTTGRDKNAITLAALTDYLDAEARQHREILEGIAEADRGDFAGVHEVHAFFARYGA